MNFLSPKIVLIFVLLLAILAVSSFIYFSNKPSSSSLPVQKMDTVSPSPSPPPPAVPYEQLTQEQKNQYQSQSDEYYQKTQDKILRNYPWYFDLPLKDTNYFVDFDPSSEAFIAMLYPQKSSSVSLDEQVEEMKKIITQRINTLGSDTGKYKIEWKVIPE